MASEPVTSPNPYAAPNKLVTSAEETATRCSFCDRPASEVGPLVKNPGATSYICESCAQSALSICTSSKPGSVWKPIVGVIILILGVSLVIYDMTLPVPAINARLWPVILGIACLVGAWFEIIVPWLQRFSKNH